MTPAPMLDVDTLVIRYRAGLFAARPKPAVNGASFRLERGETLGIDGESGSGKTSLLRAILRLLPVESGAIRRSAIDGDQPVGRFGVDLFLVTHCFAHAG